MSEKCQSCKTEDAEPEHRCPFKEEIYGSDATCNCCNECQRQCAMDI